MPQLELRKFMKEHKNKRKDVNKINSPLAKYPFLNCKTLPKH